MKPLLPLTVVFLSACAAVKIDAGQCSSAYDLGFRDAIMSLVPQDTLYDPVCKSNGTPLDLALYKQGWLDGHYEVENRMPHTE